jgi:hypothetical protein
MRYLNVDRWQQRLTLMLEGLNFDIPLNSR